MNTPENWCMERPTKTAAYPRWLTILFILVIGLILWMGVLSMPGIDSIMYVAVVIGVVALLAYADRKRKRL